MLSWGDQARSDDRRSIGHSIKRPRPRRVETSKRAGIAPGVSGTGQHVHARWPHGGWEADKRALTDRRNAPQVMGWFSRWRRPADRERRACLVQEHALYRPGRPRRARPQARWPAKEARPPTGRSSEPQSDSIRNPRPSHARHERRRSWMEACPTPPQRQHPASAWHGPCHDPCHGADGARWLSVVSPAPLAGDALHERLTSKPHLPPGARSPG